MEKDDAIEYRWWSPSDGKMQGDREPVEVIPSSDDTKSPNHPNAMITVKTISGKIIQNVLNKKTTPCLLSSTLGLPDILDLDDFSEDSMIYNVRSRYQSGRWYTYVGRILISINPFQWNKELYSLEQMQSYKGLRLKSLLEPHLFAVADAALQNLKGMGEVCLHQNQSIIVSGESGAGKKK